MTKKDYIVLVKAYSKVMKEHEDLDTETLKYFFDATVEALKEDNPSFDITKFYSGIMKGAIRD